RYRLLEFVRFPHRLHRRIHPGDRLRSEVADFPFQYDQRISFQCPGGTLSGLRNLRSTAAAGNGQLQHDYADGTGSDSAYAESVPLRRRAAVGKYAAVLVV